MNQLRDVQHRIRARNARPIALDSMKTPIVIAISALLASETWYRLAVGNC
jgi:hypothetical protein